MAVKSQRQMIQAGRRRQRHMVGRLPWRALRRSCDPSEIPAQSTEKVAPLDGEIVGQARALSALEMAIRVRDLDYNVYVSGSPRTGKTFLVTSYLKKVAKDLPTPRDWVYVYNFDDPDRPRALWLPPGRGRAFRKEMESLIREAQVALEKSFQGDAYQVRREAILSEVQRERNDLLRDLEKKVEARGHLLQLRSDGMSICPARDGKAMSDEEIKALSADRRAQIQAVGDELQKEMSQVVRGIQSAERMAREAEASLREQVAREALGPLFQKALERYSEVPPVKEHLAQVQEDIIGSLEALYVWEETDDPAQGGGGPQAHWQRYAVNLIVDHSEGRGAPVVIEPNPTYINLFGGVERKAEMGVLVTDFTLIRPGALHRANGGFLILQAADLMQWPLAWEGLKRALRFGEVKIEEIGEQLGMVAAKGLSPEPIPLECKVILIGSPHLYQLLYGLDDYFPKIFKVKADLDDQMPRGPEEVKRFCSYLATVCRKWGLLPIDRGGMARLVEYASELAGHQEKLTLQLSEVEDIVREAHIWAKDGGATHIGAKEVERAIREKVRRSSLPEERLQELIEDGFLKIETRGAVVGSVNGLSVYDLGDHVFARPTRVTASISLGREGVLDVEREAKLGGNIHTKGILILTGFLRWRFAQERPLSLSASLCFEQSYEDVDGDSASGAEICALLSSLADAPVRQGIALTGAVSQHGEMLPVGDVTRKIEGFYQVCKLQGITGTQGVLIPSRNVTDLMLSPEVLEAVRKRQFHVYAVEDVDQAMEILTGIPAGKRLKDGSFEPGSLNDRIDKKLRRLNELYRESAHDEE